LKFKTTNKTKEKQRETKQTNKFKEKFESDHCNADAGKVFVETSFLLECKQPHLQKGAITGA